MIDSTVNLSIAMRFESKANGLEAHVAYIIKEQADPDGSWMDSYSQDDIAKLKQEVIDLRYAAEVLKRSPDLQFDSDQSK